jgi:polygalacturonase
MEKVIMVVCCELLTTLFATVCLASALQVPDIPLPEIPSHTFKITDYGAVADGKTLNTEAFVKAIAACNAAGGGKVIVPAGEFLSGPFEFVSKMALHLEKGAVLRFSDDVALYKVPGIKERPNEGTDGVSATLRASITGKSLTDIAITGQGTIDGNGKAWWPRSGKKAWVGDKPLSAPLPRTDLIQFANCKRVLIENVTICNAPQFHVVPHYCDGVICRDLKILAPANSPNTDGIDPTNSRNVLITRCLIDVGDDNISLKARRDANDKITVPTENIYVTDCTFLNGHGVSVGSRVWSGIRNIFVDNCTFDGTDNGIRIKSSRTRGGLIKNINYSNITMKNVGTALSINMYYFDRTEGAQPITAETPIVRNVRIQNISVTGAKSAGNITGLPEMPVSDVVLENVDIAAQTGMRIKYAKSVELKQVKIKAGMGKPLTIESASVKGAEGFGDTTPSVELSKEGAQAKKTK